MPEWALTRIEQSVRDRAETIDELVHAPLATVTRGAYRRWLCELYRFIAPVEARLRLAPGLDAMLEERFKSSLLAADLLVLGLNPLTRARLARLVVVPELGDTPTALGWLFIVERLTLHLDATYKRLEASLEVELDAAGSFLDAYGGDGMQRWLELAQLFDDQLCNGHDIEVATAAARSALDCLERALGDDVLSAFVTIAQASEPVTALPRPRACATVTAAPSSCDGAAPRARDPARPA